MTLVQMESTVANFTRKHQATDIQTTQRLLEGQERFSTVTPIETTYAHLLKRLSKRKKQNFKKMRF